MFFFAKMEGGVLPSFSNEVIYFNVLGVDKIIRCLLHILLPKILFGLVLKRCLPNFESLKCF